MSEYGTTLRLKRHEDLVKVAAYVKQQVREKSIEQVGEDLSEKGDFLGDYVRINEDKNEILWHDYEHHRKHFDFNPIAESVIKVFPGVEMERQVWWESQGVWNYFIVDGKWQEYTLWKFFAYVEGKGEEVQLEYKQPKEGRTEEEKHEERDKMCKEMAERLSRLHPDVEIAVYAYDWYNVYDWFLRTIGGYKVEEFYRAKDGHATKEMVHRGLVAIMDCGYFNGAEWVESVGHVLLHPMEFIAKLIRQDVDPYVDDPTEKQDELLRIIAVKMEMCVRELRMREYFDENIDDYNTAFSFVVDYKGMQYTVDELFCDCICPIGEIEHYIACYLMARSEHDDSKLHWLIEKSQLNEDTETIIKIEDL